MSRDFGVTSSRMPKVPNDYKPRKRNSRPTNPKNSVPNARRATATNTRQRNDAPQQPQQPRKVYSPYGNDRSGFLEEEDVEMKDGLNRFGDFLADSVDSLLWGPDDGDDDVIEVVPESSTSDDTPNKRRYVDQRKTSASARKRASTTSRNWKDRLEQRVDTVLGIDQDGKTYQRWMKTEEKDEAEAT
ncbi:MAG: hypothetical protein SGARI_006989, partial [Bacillariaceae sp.]